MFLPELWMPSTFWSTFSNPGRDSPALALGGQAGGGAEPPARSFCEDGGSDLHFLPCGDTPPGDVLLLGGMALLGGIGVTTTESGHNPNPGHSHRAQMAELQAGWRA